MREDRRVQQRDDEQRVRPVERRDMREGPVHEHPVDTGHENDLREITKSGAATGASDGAA
jgi:hypothetical protein